MLRYTHSAYVRVRNRRVSRTIIYSMCAGAPVCYVGSLVHGFLVGSVVGIVALYHYTNKLERYHRVSRIGG